MFKRNSLGKNETTMGCVRESPQIKKKKKYGCVRETTQIKQTKPAQDV